jgi:hypothetical protein
MAAVLADIGALVALLDRSDRWHERAVDVFTIAAPARPDCGSRLSGPSAKLTPIDSAHFPG